MMKLDDRSIVIQRARDPPGKVTQATLEESISIRFTVCVKERELRTVATRQPRLR